MRYAIDVIRALPCALLPKRYWDSFDLPVANVATASAFVMLLAGIAIGIRGYFQYLDRLRHSGVGIVEISQLQVQGKLPESVEVSAIPSALYMTAPFTFAFFTPLGLFAAYLVISSFFRLAAAYVDETHGDPLLSGVDALGRRFFGSQRAQRERAAREKLEGANQPDRLYEGTWAGLADVSYVLVAARRKDGWTRGTWIITNDGWFTLGEPFDRQTPNGLRTIYPLTLQTSTLDVLRKGVSYELPPLRKKKPDVAN